MATELSIFGNNTQSKSCTISAQDRINVFFDVPTQPDRAPVAAYGTPGTDYFCTPSSAVTRGMYFMPQLGLAFILQERKLFTLSVNTPNPTPQLVATLYWTQDVQSKACFTDNGQQLLLVTGENGYIFDTTNNFKQTDITPQLPPEGSDSCCFLDGFFIVNRRNTQQFFISQPYDGLKWNALDFASAESAPDNLVAVSANNGYLYLLGQYSTEIWVNNGGALFPFSRIQGATITYGLVSIDSLTVINTSLIALVRDRYGMLAIGTMANGQFATVSTTDITYIINQYPDVQSADAFVYAIDGRYFYQITFNQSQTWLYDFKSTAWSRIQSGTDTKSKYQYGLAFGQKFIVSSATDGGLAMLNIDTFTEEGTPVIREIRFNHIFAASQNYTLISRIRAWFETGQGLVGNGTTVNNTDQPQGTNPQCYLQISRDGGHTCGEYLKTELGRRGEFTARAEWRRLGAARDWVLKIRVSDPVKFVLTDVSLAIGEANQ